MLTDCTTGPGGVHRTRCILADSHRFVNNFFQKSQQILWRPESSFRVRYLCKRKSSIPKNGAFMATRNGLASLRRSHGRANSPPDCLLGPTFRVRFLHIHRKTKSSIPKNGAFMATRNGLEPSTSSVTGWRANRLHHRARWCSPNKMYSSRLAPICQHIFSNFLKIFQHGHSDRKSI